MRIRSQGKAPGLFDAIIGSSWCRVSCGRLRRRFIARSRQCFIKARCAWPFPNRFYGAVSSATNQGQGPWPCRLCHRFIVPPRSRLIPTPSECHPPRRFRRRCSTSESALRRASANLIPRPIGLHIRDCEVPFDPTMSRISTSTTRRSLRL